MFMSKGKTSFFRVSKTAFDREIRPKLEKELREAASIDSGPPGGPAGGLSNGFDSLTAVVVVEVVLPAHLGKSPPAEKIIREGGYETVDEFIDDVLPKLRALCADIAETLEGQTDNEEDGSE